MEILQNIGKSITEALSKAVEAYIAVALVKDYSFSILEFRIEWLGRCSSDGTIGKALVE